MASKVPKAGWIYFIDPYLVSLKYPMGHNYIYQLTKPGDVTCKKSDCNLTINSSRVFRGKHPHIIWESESFQNDHTNYKQTFTVIPLTSQTTFTFLSTCVAINKTAQNGLERDYYALVHQILTVDGNCFKYINGDWIPRIGRISTDDKADLKDALAYYLNIDISTEDWLKNNASPELLKQVFDYLPQEQQSEGLNKLI